MVRRQAPDMVWYDGRRRHSEAEGFREAAPRSRGDKPFLFGSTARGTATETSDLDVFFDIDPASRFSLFDLVRAKHLIEDELGVKADVGTRGGLHRLLKEEIERDAIRVF